MDGNEFNYQYISGTVGSEVVLMQIETQYSVCPTPRVIIRYINSSGEFIELGSGETWVPASGGEGGGGTPLTQNVLRATATFDQAGMRTLHTTAVQLVPDQVEGKQIMPIYAVFSRGNGNASYNQVAIDIQDQAAGNGTRMITLDANAGLLNYGGACSIARYCTTTELQSAVQKWGNNGLYIKARADLGLVGEYPMTVDVFYTILDVEGMDHVDAAP